MSGRLALDTTGSKHQIHFNVVVIIAIVAPIASTLDLTTFTSGNLLKRELNYFAECGSEFLKNA